MCDGTKFEFMSIMLWNPYAWWRRRYSRSLFGTSVNSSVVILWLTHFAQFVDVYFTVANLLLSAVVFPMFVAETDDACMSRSTCLWRLYATFKLHIEESWLRIQERCRFSSDLRCQLYLWPRNWCAMNHASSVNGENDCRRLREM